MREIKIRIFDKKNKKILEVDTLFINEAMFKPVGGDEYSVWNYDTEYYSNPMQYTGLKDKNGVLIFEGDIVTTSYRDTNAYIYYSAPTFGLKDKIGICTDFTWEDFNEFEVIGNIYEHSHSLDNN